LTSLKVNNKALSPVVAAIILVAVTTAVSIAVGAWMGIISFNNMQVEEIAITGHTWAPDNSYIDIIIQNKGTRAFTLGTVLINGETITDWNITDGDITLNSGESRILRISYNFIEGNTYEFKILTMNDKGIIYRVTMQK